MLVSTKGTKGLRGVAIVVRKKVGSKMILRLVNHAIEYTSEILAEGRVVSG